MEIGANYLKQKELQNATASFFSANEIMESIFSDDHPILQKYYSYAIEVASNANNNEQMLELTHKNL